ncbi:hypothetical protein PV646_28865 [Streptomyces sp. ID05-26A]|nr:hypothetical protein [Streptomyces sp. ID05-26A]
MNLCAYLLHAFGWSAFGATVGVLLDRAVIRYRTRPKGIVVPDRKQNDNGWWRRYSGAVVPAVLIVLAIVTAVQGVVLNRVNEQQDQCQLAYANGFADALEARTRTSADAQSALDDLMRLVGQALRTGTARDPEPVQKAVDNYLQQREAAKATQRDNPYPPAPRDLCK